MERCQGKSLQYPFDRASTRRAGVADRASPERCDLLGPCTETGYLLKGNRGAREDQYVILAAFESVELRDRYFPATGEAFEEWQQRREPFTAELEQTGTLTT